MPNTLVTIPTETKIELLEVPDILKFLLTLYKDLCFSLSL